ncbi:NAD(P)/FAD-dependent oxidoreductase [Sneathiella litorea]|uniref:FAD-dependent oxidoreductase n=1 Tax=Sneathiella litorea TaxID=2606216 RepID=A0A6L8WAT5_9PROT|nr:FAD-dependent oxidoreductase [Sneathiella litorea]MZR31819.1 FAD-dependent oxidoreductase [Sneathiella litorea]
MSDKYDAVIIGAGVIGACIAYELSKAGRKVLSIDRLPASGFGSTSASCAIIRTYYSALDTCALAYEGWFYWKNWADYIGVEDEKGLIKYHDTGALIVKTPHNDYMQKICTLMDKIGCPYEHLTPEQMREKLPIIDTHQFAPVKRPEDPTFGEPTDETVPGGVFFPRGGYVSDPQLAAHNAQRAAEAHGATFKFNAEVTTIRQSGGRVTGVTLKDGTEIDAPVVVNVAGPHSGKVNEMAGVLEDMKMTTRALRHEVAHVPSPDGFDFESDGVVLSDSDVGVYCRPELGNHILIGSEDPKCDTQEWVDPDNFNEDFTEQWNAQVLRLAQRFPALGIPRKTKGVVALYDVTRDWVPIYDKTSLDGYYLAIGTSGNQFKNAPVAGRMMEKLIRECEAGRDHDADPVHFHLENIDYDLSMGTFSRNREVSKDSSFTVLG